MHARCATPQENHKGVVGLTHVIKTFLGMEVFFPDVSLPRGTVPFDTGRSKAGRCKDCSRPPFRFVPYGTNTTQYSGTWVGSYHDLKSPPYL